MPDNLVRLREIIRDCVLCPRCCRVDRSQGRLGACRIGARAVVASAGPHFGEEPVLVGDGGSGTIFFSGCNLDCVFCQNADISHTTDGTEATPAQIAALALGLQRRGCVNVNFVTPTHVSHAVGEAIVLARRDGLTVPIVHNCGGYESVQTLKLLDGLIEVYMPDFKYADAAAGKKYSGVPEYPAVATAALAEMYRQVGPLVLGSAGSLPARASPVIGSTGVSPVNVARRGVLVRHLVMPGDLARSKEVIDIVARVAPGCSINVMGQYRPCFRAGEFPELMSPPTIGEVRNLRQHATERGLTRAD